MGLPVSCGCTWDTKKLQGIKLAQKTPELNDLSTDTNSSDKSEEGEEGTGGDSGEDEDEENEDEPRAPPPASKSKAKRKAEIATATTGKPKGRVSSTAGPISARAEKKKRSKV